MKRLFTLLLIAALVGVASATSLNFQNPTDLASITTYSYASTGSATWSESGVGGNNYISVYHHPNDVPGDCVYGIMNVNANSMTYSAATLVYKHGQTADGYARLSALLLDSGKNRIGGFTQLSTNVGDRLEVKVSGGIATLYKNGAAVATSGALAVNPSYIVWGSTYGNDYSLTLGVDDIVWGSAENKYVFGLPESDNQTYIILSDITNPSAAGLAFGSNGTVVNSNNMVGTWSRGNLSTPLTNESITLVYYPTGQVVETTYTGNAFYGSHSFDILTNVINNPNAPMGLYAVTIPNSGMYSNQIWYKSNGASVQWSSKTYSTGDTASIITIVSSGNYWDTSTYNYLCGVMDVYGQFHGVNTSITTQTATVTHSWNADTDSPGVYYAVLIATSRSTGVQYILGYDYTELSSYVNFNGWVNNAQNQTVISGANVSMTQDGTVCNTLSAADGNYTCSGFSTGATWYVNATATGFRQYTFNTTPLAAKGVALNISLEPILPIMSGISIGGVDRDTTYGRPIKEALVTVRNTTSGLYCYKNTSMTGWYLNDETDCLFQSKTPYDAWAYKIGYTNSTTEKAVTA